MKSKITILVLSTIAILSAIAVMTAISNQVFAQSSQGNTDVVSNTVNAGGNGSDWDKFSPHNITINASESVTWINPMPVPEPHTVTILKDPSLFPPLLAPFSIPNNTKLTSAIPAPNVEPAVMPDPSNPNNKLVIVDNARASNPVVIDSTGTNVTHLPVNANYSFSGDESYINSGWMWPEGKTSAEKCDIAIEGDNKWRTLIQNASNTQIYKENHSI